MPSPHNPPTSLRKLWLTCACFFLTSVLAAQTPATNPTTNQAGKFEDTTIKSGINFLGQASHTSRKYLIETMGSGVALFDYDNDGLLDIFFVNGAPLSDPMPKDAIPQKTEPKYWNRLYHQKKDGTFEDVTERAGLQGIGYGMGVAVGDYDNDGYEDLYVTALGGNRLYHNNGNGTFTDVTDKSATGGSGWSTSAAWVDLDNDGLLDLVVLRYMVWDFTDIFCGEHREGYRAYCHPNLFPPATPLVYHNDGNGHFTESAAKTGINQPGKGLGLAIGDYDHNGKIDVVVANDSMTEFLYQNKGNGTFDEVGLFTSMAVNDDGRTFAGMGIDLEDYDNDGLPDIIITDLAHEKYALYHNSGDGTFAYTTNTTGVSSITMQHSGWGVRFLDYDNDGHKDLLIAQGHDLDSIELTMPGVHYREPMLLMRNTGKGFTDVSAQSGEVFQQSWVGRALATGDLDNDGRIDAVVTTNGGPSYILHNSTVSTNHWITLALTGHKSNRDAIGASVKITTASGSQYATVTTTGSYLSSSDKRLHFGLGQDTIIKTIEIHWPSGTTKTLKETPANQFLKIEEPTDPTPSTAPKP